MAGKIVADTLEHSTAGSIATNFVVKGGSKGYCHFNQAAATDLAVNTSSSVLVDTLNTTSLTDTGTGKGTINWTSAMSNVNYTCATGTGTVSGTAANAASLNDNDAFVTRTASAWSFIANFSSSSADGIFDCNESICVAYGDLA